MKHDLHSIALSRRTILKGGGALLVCSALPRAFAQTAGDAALGKPLDVGEVDSFFAVHQDGLVTLYCGKVDLGTGLRIAIPQMAAEELCVPISAITLIEGDTALTPDQGPTAGSTGIQRGGVQIRQAAASAREALIAMAAQRLGRPSADLVAIDGEVRSTDGSARVSYGELIGERRFGIKLDEKAPLKDPARYTIVGKPLPRPDIPAKVSGKHVYVHDFKLPGMVHARVIHPASVGAEIVDVDDKALAKLPGVRVVRVRNFLAVVAPDEWDAIVGARSLVVRWSKSAPLIGNAEVPAWMRAGPFASEETLTRKGDAVAALATASQKVRGTFYWPPQTHGSIGPSCAVADVRDGKAKIWTASQGTHRYRDTYARILGLPAANVRLIYLDGAGCYGMNGHDDAAADAMLLSKELGKPVRVQWSREDEHGWDPKGPPQLLDIEASLTDNGGIGAWRTDMWIPKATANLPNVPLLSPQAAGIEQPKGIATGLIFQNGAPPYACENVSVDAHWLADAPLRPSNIRAPGKPANVFAVESIVDMLAAKAGVDPVEFRLRGLSDPRGIEVVKRTAAAIAWQPRTSAARNGKGRGFAYCHYKLNETYVAMAMDVVVDRASGVVRVLRVACAHDCGLAINPDAVRAQVEGNILQTLSRALYEEVAFDRARVTSTDWSSYPILRFPEVPSITVDIVDRPQSPPLGAGEASATPVAAALANAIYDATGVRLTTVPFTKERLKAAASSLRQSESRS
jgi:CO/xanthine dehydrogenase Mo-binding subunit